MDKEILPAMRRKPPLRIIPMQSIAAAVIGHEVAIDIDDIGKAQ
jgi:hypothetical protein